MSSTATARLRASVKARRLGRGPLAAGSWVIVALFVIVAAVGPLLVGADPARGTNDTLLPMGAPGHLLGTDDLGRDELARMIHGAQPLLMVAFLSTGLAALLGIGIGLIAGYAGGWIEWVLMRCMDLALAFPSMLLIILIVSAWRPGVGSMVAGIALALAPGLARLARALAAREARRDYVLAAKLGGTRGPRLLVQEILPNIAGPMLAQVVMTLSVAAGFAAGLSYLGLGIQPPTPDWGYMVQAGQEFLYTAPRLVVLPAAATLIFVVACNFVGDDLRDALDPRASGTAGSR
ncbi:ABC-type dipeptide/oligopeptide/nickel transport system permease subunit [Catenuloplanes nepalensis]|uniref:ABC-type dipeptide/oligopeptide/nickel transport system permease subunit n=1 Tax=Catenuloplanes nepalensis TaxID=587533 RepID=A0ABT9MLB4_9ACTN|nr:ABC transporter permease [Catenuloplanes nepalensis]MDP9792217.1 ABC-type dipeptide/oligopeptide/nickel transport system permease subunit [Catenuloplanes nepalensis]